MMPQNIPLVALFGLTLFVAVAFSQNHQRPEYTHGVAVNEKTAMITGYRWEKGQIVPHVLYTNTFGFIWWLWRFPQLSSSSEFARLIYDPTSRNFITMESKGNIYTSSNQGQSWKQIPGLAVAPGETVAGIYQTPTGFLVLGKNGNIYETPALDHPWSSTFIDAKLLTGYANAHHVSVISRSESSFATNPKPAALSYDAFSIQWRFGTFSGVNGVTTLFEVAYGNFTFMAVGSVLPKPNARDSYPAIFKSTSGRDWQLVYANTTSTLPPRAMYSIAYTDGVWMAVGQSLSILVSKDNGVTWIASTDIPKSEPGDPEEFYSVFGASANNWVALGANKIWVSNDGGESWMDTIDNILEK